MRFQRNPSAARIRELAMMASQIVIDEVSCKGMHFNDLLHIEEVRNAIIGAADSLRKSEVSASDVDFDQIGERIGGALRKLNTSWIYLQAETRSEDLAGTGATSDGHGSTQFVTIHVIHGERAAA